jgi:hypothetical protein
MFTNPLLVAALGLCGGAPSPINLGGDGKPAAASSVCGGFYIWPHWRNPRHARPLNAYLEVTGLLFKLTTTSTDNTVNQPLGHTEWQARERAAHVDGVEASIRRYCFGGVVVDGADGVVAGGFVAPGIKGSIVWLRGQNTAATITTTITATIAYQKTLLSEEVHGDLSHLIRSRRIARATTPTGL